MPAIIMTDGNIFSEYYRAKNNFRTKKYFVKVCLTPKITLKSGIQKV